MAEMIFLFFKHGDDCFKDKPRNCACCYAESGKSRGVIYYNSAAGYDRRRTELTCIVAEGAYNGNADETEFIACKFKKQPHCEGGKYSARKAHYACREPTGDKRKTAFYKGYC